MKKNHTEKNDIRKSLCMNFFKGEKGSVTVYVLSIMIVLLLILTATYVSFMSKNTAQNKKISDIEKESENTVTEEKMEAAYNGVTQLANKPVLTDGMIPVKFDPTINSGKGSWVICSETDSNWYDYSEDKNQWANVMLSDGKYYASNASGSKAGKTLAKEGTAVDEEDLGSMFVWIPRFAYKITSGYHQNGKDSSDPGKIDVKFLVGTSNKTSDSDKIVEYNSETTNGYTNFPDGYVVHPAFRNGSSTGYSNGEWKAEIEGLWMSKFQAGIYTTGNDTTARVSSVNNFYYPVFKGRKFGYNIANVSQCYNLSQALDGSGNPYGLTSAANSHLIKDSEWGAVAYLSMSKYGYSGGIVTEDTEMARNNLDINGTVDNPNNSNWKIYGITGYSAKGGKTDRNSISYKSMYDTLGSGDTISTAWNIITPWKDSGDGTKSSTTGNIYGVYDMSSGLATYTATYINNLSSANSNGEAITTGTSTYFATAYPNTSVTESNFNTLYTSGKLRAIYGNAIYETSQNVGSGLAWFGDTLEEDSQENQNYIFRGGNYYGSTFSGLCSVQDTHGPGAAECGFRSTIIVE